jgi:hypothetical protein
MHSHWLFAIALVGCSAKVDSIEPASQLDSATLDALAETSVETSIDSASATLVDSALDTSTVTAETAVDTGPEVCVPKTCVGVGAECGTIDDGCGGIVTCAGSCAEPNGVVGAASPTSAAARRRGTPFRPSQE